MSIYQESIQSSISESDRAEMEGFIQNIKTLINTLGHKAFEEKRALSLTSIKQKVLSILRQ